jgi:N6-adenosine-specific RNA methylase IME4
VQKTSIIRIGSQALQLDLFELKPTGLAVRGKPTLEQWTECGRVLCLFEGAVQWWIGDWVNYGATRKDWGEKYNEAKIATGYDQRTLENYAFVAQNIQFTRRRENLSFSIHSEIARLPTTKEQTRWLDAAEEGDDGVAWSVGRLRREIQLKRLETRTPSALPGVFEVLCADPPWAYDNSGFTQSAAEQYPTLDIDAIAALPETEPTFPKAADDSVLFLWATSPLLEDSFRVMQAWGFEYKASLVWAKDSAPGIGWWVRTRHELLLIGERGSLHPVVTPDSVVAAANGRHSEKPDEFYRLIESMYPQFRRVELFARTERPGWSAWGNEI